MFLLQLKKEKKTEGIGISNLLPLQTNKNRLSWGSGTLSFGVYVSYPTPTRVWGLPCSPVLSCVGAHQGHVTCCASKLVICKVRSETQASSLLTGIFPLNC